MSYAFGDYVLDLRRFQLRRGSEVIPLEPKVFDVLRYLVEHHDRVATKRELLDALWANEVVTEAVLPTNINALRRALGQQRGDKLPIATVHGRGYRFAAEVTHTAPSDAPRAANTAPPSEPEGAEDDEDGPFVGHAAILSKLKRSAVRALGGQGQVCVLRGEAGIGKTRIARRIAQLMRAYGADVWLGTCPEGLGTPPFWIWQEVLRSAKASEGVVALKRMLSANGAEIPPLLAAWLEEQDGALLDLGERDRFRLHDTLVRLLTVTAKVRPKVIWLEDMHRADDASWQLLRLLAPHLAQLPVLVLCTVRSRDDLTTAFPIQRHVDDLGRLSYCHRIHVPPLDAEETQRLLRELLHETPSAELTQLVCDKTSGNPLFVRELVDAFVAHGQREDLPSLRGVAPPDVIRHVLRRRVTRLGEEETRVLEMASLLGPELDVSLAAHVADLPIETLCGIFERAEVARVLVRVTEHALRYRFAHELLRDTLYADLDSATKRQLHLRAASWLEARAEAGSDVRAQDLALHLLQALPSGDALHAVRWLVRGAEECTRASAHADAVRLYRSAREVARSLSPPPTAELDTLEGALTAAEHALRESRRSSVN